MKKRDLLAGTGAIAAALAAYTAAEQINSTPPPPLETENVVVIAPEGEATVAQATEDGDLEASPAHMKWALGAAIGSLLGGIAAAFGINRLMNLLASSGKAASKAAGAVAKSTGKAAKATGAAAARLFESPGRAVARTSVAALGIVVAVALLDVSWKASLAVSAGSVLIGALGWRKRARTRSTAPLPS